MTDGLQQWRDEFPGYYCRPVALAENAAVRIVLQQVECYSRSCVFHLGLAARRIAENETRWPDKHAARFVGPDNHDGLRVRIAIRFPDGSIAAPPTSPLVYPGAAPNDTHRLVFGHSTSVTGEYATVTRAIFELSPIPSAPEITFLTSWPLFDLGVQETRLATQPLHAAAQHAQPHWDPPPSTRR